MEWLLVVFVLNTPVKTNLVFKDLDSCLSAEEKMRTEWADTFNRAQKANASKETMDLIRTQITSGTCIPARADK